MRSIFYYQVLQTMGKKGKRRCTMKRLSLTMICAALVFAACETDTAKAPLAPPEMVETEDGKNDMISYQTDIVGEFKYYGEKITGDFLPHGYVGFKFTGKGGEVVSVELNSLTRNRDTVLWVYPPAETDDFWGEIWRRPIAQNDDIDYPSNTNSAVHNVVLPRDGVYLVVVGEYRGRNGSFEVTLLCDGGGCENSSVFCGGIAGLPCPDGFWCKLDGDYPDAGGQCLPTGRCEVGDDCWSQDLIHPMCLGTWECSYDSGEALGICQFDCNYEPVTTCSIQGGDCGYFTDGCDEGFEAFMGEPWGCPGGRSGICCLPDETATYACTQDSDCVMANSSCCPCSSGGRLVAVNVNHVDRVTPDPGSCPEDLMCPMVYMCFGRAACVDNVCTVVTD